MLTIAIIARDEARYIADALRSATPLAARLVVLLDPRTTDATAGLAAAQGATVVMEPFRSFPAQRNRALAICTTPWLLFLDADERLTSELCAEIAAVIADPSAGAGYTMPRRNRYWRRWLRGGGWYPDRQLRLLQVGQAHYDERRLVHELVAVSGPIGELHGHLLHLNINSLGELRSKQRRYALAEAQSLWLGGDRARWRNLVLQPAREVWRRWWTWQGYRDGLLGLALALIMGYYEWVKFVHLKALALLRRP